ncbi:hypothetical protein ANO14919_058110 [Xylariales sp. No.14919]|nr:hypothetical protein ANO14919_058110 [Xylariales sp. No.14919]
MSSRQLGSAAGKERGLRRSQKKVSDEGANVGSVVNTTHDTQPARKRKKNNTLDGEIGDAQGRKGTEQQEPTGGPTAEGEEKGK